MASKVPYHPCHDALKVHRALIKSYPVGEVSPSDTAVTIVNLLPSHFYTIRVTAVNTTSFQASSHAVRVKALETLHAADSIDSSHSEGHDATSTTPAVVPYRGLRDSHSGSLSAHSTSRELVPNQTPQRRNSNRRVSPSPQHDNFDRRHSDLETASSETTATVQALTEKLNSLRKEIDELDRQDHLEEDQHQAERTRLISKRDELRNQLKEKDEESKDLNKNVTILQRQSTAAQNQKRNHEKMLQSRRIERQRIQDDVQRWKRQTSAMQEDAQTLQSKIDQVEAAGSESVQEICEERKEDQLAMKQLEEQIRDTGKHVKELEDHQKSTSEESGNTDSAKWSRKVTQDHYEWIERYRELQQKHQKAHMQCYQAAMQLQSLRARVEELSNQRRGSQASFYTPMMQQEAFFSPQESQPVPYRLGVRFSASGVPLQLPPTASIPGDIRSSQSPSLANHSPTAFGMHDQTSMPSMTSGSVFGNPLLNDPSVQQEMNRLNSGANPIPSPSATGLLPSGLLGDETEEAALRRAPRSPRHVGSADLRRASTVPISALDPSKDSSPELVGPLPGLGAVDSSESNPALNQISQNSPSWHDSRSPSLTSSPHGSMSMAHHQSKLSEGTMDSDRKSLASTGSDPRAVKRSRMFGDLFSMRQRGKSTTDEGLAFGTLKSAHTQSLPRTDALDVESRKPAGVGLLGSVSNAFGGRMGSSSVFGSKASPFARTSAGMASSSRPASTYSAEPFGPPSSDKLPLGWNDVLSGSNTTRTGRGPLPNPWSTGASRRESIGIDSTSSLNERFSQLDEEDDAPIEPPGESGSAPQPPIGTKSGKGKKASTSGSSALSAAPLNPNARDFRSIFIRGDKKFDKSDGKPSKKKTKDKEKEKENQLREEEEQTTSHDDESFLEHLTNPTSSTLSTDHAPPDLRIPGKASLSVGENTDDESRSIHTSRTSESGGPSTPVTVESNTPGGSGTPTPGRESFMKKLTRKGSSSKFSLGLKPRMSSSKVPTTSGSATTTATSEATEEEREEGDTMLMPSASGHKHSSAGNSATSSPMVGGNAADKENSGFGSLTKRGSGFSLASFKRRVRKDRDKDKDEPSVSEASMLSESTGGSSGATGEAGGSQGQGVGLGLEGEGGESGED